MTGIDEERSDEEPPHLYGGNPPEDSSTVFAMQKHRTKRKSISGKQLFSKLILAFCKVLRTEKLVPGTGIEPVLLVGSRF